MEVGALDADNDTLLADVFVDTGLLSKLLDPQHPWFLVVGRTGSGKTALLREIERRNPQCRRLDPEELSMQYLQNSQILRFLTALDINLGIFYRYLWRHVCVLEIARLRYTDLEPPGWIAKLFSRKEADAQLAASAYVEKHENYWITSEACVKDVVDEVTNKLRNDVSGSMALDRAAKVGIAGASSREVESHSRITSAQTKRVQEIVSSVLVTDLNKALEALSGGGFKNKQQHYFVLIDDLDKNWMPDDALYIELIRCLLTSVRDINVKLPTVKIVVAVRENIFQRVLQDPGRAPQREKWQDYIAYVRWTRSELTEMLRQRVAVVLRDQYTEDPPSLQDLFPASSKKRRKKPEAIDYILDRTLDRPRDVIRFVNMAIENATSSRSATGITWDGMRRIEKAYSEDRLLSLYDEWRDSYPFLPALCEIPRKLGARFARADLTDEVIQAVYQAEIPEGSEWLNQLVDSADWRAKVLGVLVLVGVLGVKDTPADSVRYSWQTPHPILGGSDGEKAVFYVHGVFHRALGIADSAT